MPGEVPSDMHVGTLVGAWRSLVAHYTGGVGVAGSNPAAPTIYFKRTFEPAGPGRLQDLPLARLF